MNYSDTICAPATVAGTGAISIVRISGPKSFEIVDRAVRFRHGTAAGSKGYSLKFADICGVDEGMVAIFRAPHSYTGEDSVELYCHASAFIVSKVLERLVDEGCRMAGPGEFTRRAFVNGKMDLAQAEAVADVISASSEASHRVAMNQLKGGYTNELKGLRDQLLELSALLELELDFSEEEVEFAGRARLDSLLSETLGHVSRLAESFRAGNALKNGVPVAFVGAVNAGKSTLLNALVGEERAIVSDIPGTTRDTVEEIITIDGMQFRFIDTAGLRDTDDTIEKIGIERSLEAVSKADVVIGVVSAVSPDLSGEAAEIRRLAEGKELILVVSKGDLVDSEVDGSESARAGLDGALMISAAKGRGLDELRSRLAASQRDRLNAGADTLVTSMRHYEALCAARESLQAVRDGLALSIPTDLLAEDLRQAISALGSIWGEGMISAQETLNAIFSRHCIGK